MIILKAQLTTEKSWPPTNNNWTALGCHCWLSVLNWEYYRQSAMKGFPAIHFRNNKSLLGLYNHIDCSDHGPPTIPRLTHTRHQEMPIGLSANAQMNGGVVGWCSYNAAGLLVANPQRLNVTSHCGRSGAFTWPRECSIQPTAATCTPDSKSHQGLRWKSCWKVVVMDYDARICTE